MTDDNSKLEHHPLADAMRFSIAAEASLGLPPGAMAEAFRRNQARIEELKAKGAALGPSASQAAQCFPPRPRLDVLNWSFRDQSR